MNDQRLERALRSGPPFRTSYIARPLPLEQPGAAGTIGRRSLAIAVVALLVGASIVIAALLASAVLPSPPTLSCADVPGVVRTPTNRWTADWPSVPVAETRAGLLTTFDGRVVRLLEPDAGGTCGSLDLGSREASLDSFAWSPDGAALAWVREANAGVGPYDLVILSRSGLVDRALRSERLLGFAWAPDGRTIAAFDQELRAGDGSPSVWLVAADGSAPVELGIDCDACAPPAALAGAPVTRRAARVAWAPSGTHIVYSISPVNPDTDLANPYRAFVGSIEQPRLTELSIGDLVAWSWLDDTTLLAHDLPDPPSWFAVAIDGPQVTALPDSASPIGLSPDGRLRLDASRLDGAIAVIDLATGATRPLTGPGMLDGTQFWAPDSARIVFAPQDPITSEPQIWIVNVDGSGTRKLSGLGVPRAWQADRSGTDGR